MLDPLEPEPHQTTPATTASRTRELAMSAAWHGGLTRSLLTIDGEPVTVVFRGHWSHGFGPDFTDAMIQVGDLDLRTGAVEIHRQASDWVRHGHHLDARYNNVILHVVARLDAPDTRRLDGALVPTVVLDIPDAVLFAIDQELLAIWDRLGGSVCASDLARREPARIRAALLRLGDQRFGERVTRYEGELTVDDLDAVMLRGLFDGFGYSENREPMAALCERLHQVGGPARIALAPPSMRQEIAAALLFGLGGFLPFSPADAHLAGLEPARSASIEGRWVTDGATPAAVIMPATAWTRARTRPANHPAARLARLATLLANTGGNPVPALLDGVRSGADAAIMLRELTRDGNEGGIGEARAVAIAASVVLPILMAHAHHRDDSELEDAVAQAWATLPRSEWSRPARRALAQVTGDVPLGRLGERANQGLLHLDRTLCTPRRCYECPIAAEVIRDTQRNRAITDPSSDIV